MDILNDFWGHFSRGPKWFFFFDFKNAPLGLGNHFVPNGTCCLFLGEKSEKSSFPLKFFACNPGAENGCAACAAGRLEKLRSFCRKTLRAGRVPRFGGGGNFGFGGGSADLIFMGVGIFLRERKHIHKIHRKSQDDAGTVPGKSRQMCFRL